MKLDSLSSRVTRRMCMLLLGTTLLSACIVAPARRERVHYDPPPAVREPAPPAATVNRWVPGHYVWRGGDWVWVGGHYVNVDVPSMPAPIAEPSYPAPSHAHVWIRGHWFWGGLRWTWAPGRWIVRGRIG